jgi:hypothetical protein
MVTNTLPKIEPQSEALQELTRRIQAEYAEMPGLSVTLAQAQRLLAIDQPTCAAVFKALISRGVLRRTPQGRYVRCEPVTSFREELRR